MSAGANISLQPAGPAPDSDIICVIEIVDRRLLAHDATLAIGVRARVKDKRAVNADKILFRRQLRVDGTSVEVRIPRTSVRCYSYRGRMLDLELFTRLVIDDGVLVDTTVSTEQQLELGLKPAVSTDASAVVEPRDLFDFFANLRAIPVRNQVITLLLAGLGGLIMLVNAAVGVHDQFVPEPQIWVYSHTDSDGDSQSPLFGSLALSGTLGAAVWFAMRAQLRTYMRFHLANPRLLIRRGDTLRAGELFGGQARVELANVRLRIVAANMECGRYKRGSGTQERTVSFEEPVRGLILYDKLVDRIPANVPINTWFSEPVDFTPMFRTLYPPVQVSPNHGLKVHWEIQLLHPEFVDQELAGPAADLQYEDFLNA